VYLVVLVAAHILFEKKMSYIWYAQNSQRARSVCCM